MEFVQEEFNSLFLNKKIGEEEEKEEELNNSFEHKLEKESKESSETGLQKEEEIPKPNNSIKPLLNYLTKLFSEEGNDQESFLQIEESLRTQLRSFLSRSFSFEGEQVQPKKTKKRNEEYIKFVIKRGFKSLFKKFKEGNNHYISGCKIEDQE